MPFKKEIIKKKRKESKLAQQELAKLLDITKQAVWNIESGISKPSLEVLEALSKVFKCSIDDFFK